jgi:hypothetical protein
MKGKTKEIELTRIIQAQRRVRLWERERERERGMPE